MARDPELLSRGLFYTAETQGRRIPQVGLGISIDDCSGSYRRAPPRLGEHTAAVLHDWLAYDETRITALHGKQVI